jgi:hypothetical protein
MKREQIVLALIFATLAAVVLFNVAPGMFSRVAAPGPDVDTQTSTTPVNSSVTAGPDYLMYNQPYFFAPPVQNFLPTTVAPLQGGASVNVATPIGACNNCGG